jgi:hypothetical protein
MSKEDPNESLEALRSQRRRRLQEMEDARGWAHHVADLDSGSVITTMLDRPVTPLSRVARISQLGHTLNDAIFGGPSQQLTAKKPYIESPAAWLIASGVESYSADENGYIEFNQPRDVEEVTWPTPHPSRIYFYFSQSPPERALFSLSVVGISWPGMNGFLNVKAWPGERSIYVGVSSFSVGSHTIDIIVDTSSDENCEAVMTILPGIAQLQFKSISLRDANAQWVVDPGLVYPW